MLCKSFRCLLLWSPQKKGKGGMKVCGMVCHWLVAHVGIKLSCVWDKPMGLGCGCSEAYLQQMSCAGINTHGPVHFISTNVTVGDSLHYPVKDVWGGLFQETQFFKFLCYFKLFVFSYSPAFAQDHLHSHCKASTCDIFIQVLAAGSCSRYITEVVLCMCNWVQYNEKFNCNYCKTHCGSHHPVPWINFVRSEMSARLLL